MTKWFANAFRMEELRKELFSSQVRSLRYAWQLVISGGNIRIFFCFLFNEPKAPTLWTTLTFWILNVSTAITAWTHNHTIFFWIKIFVPG